VLLIKHINVVLEVPGYTYVVDVSGADINPHMRPRSIKDSYAKALYWNNIGAEALLENDLPMAHAYMSKAIKTDPLITDAWVNIGVVLGRNDQLDDAEFALQRALEIDHSEFSAMSNLYEVYLAQEDMEAAEGLEEKVEKYRRGNPYYLLRLSDEALAEARFEEATRLLQSAIKRKNDDHQLHFALAKSQYLSGEIDAAEVSLVRARELAPQNMLSYYGQPLGQLVLNQ
jgi:tetratricopeptide (TPR) repeat protein